MTEKKGKSKMLVPTLIMGVLAIVLLVMGYAKGGGEHLQGLNITWKMTLEILPLLVFAFIIAGMVQVLIPQEMIGKWVGGESGMKGILIGTMAGAIMPGGPFVSLPIAAGLLRSGAGIGTMVAFLTGWSLWAVSRLPLEVGILGWKFTAIRFVSSFIFPPIAGYIAHLLFSGAKL
jgi:uncharacterized protein